MCIYIYIYIYIYMYIYIYNPTVRLPAARARLRRDALQELTLVVFILGLGFTSPVFTSCPPPVFSCWCTTTTRLPTR